MKKILFVMVGVALGIACTFGGALAATQDITLAGDPDNASDATGAITFNPDSNTLYGSVESAPAPDSIDKDGRVFSTYVVWSVDTEGNKQNIGSFGVDEEGHGSFDNLAYEGELEEVIVTFEEFSDVSEPSGVILASGMVGGVGGSEDEKDTVTRTGNNEIALVVMMAMTAGLLAAVGVKKVTSRI